MLTYTLFKTQSMLLSATCINDQPDADLHPDQKKDHALISSKQEEPTRSWLTSCSKQRACPGQARAGRACQMLTYSLFKPVLLSVTGREGQPDADLQPVQNPWDAFVNSKQKGPPRCQLTSWQNADHALVSNKQEKPARCWLTSCSKPRSCSCQQQAGKASQMLTYKLFKTQSILL